MSNLGLAITSLFSGVSAETKSRRKSSAAAFPAKASAVLEAVVGSIDIAAHQLVAACRKAGLLGTT